MCLNMQAFSPQPSALSPQPSALNPQLSALSSVMASHRISSPVVRSTSPPGTMPTPKCQGWDDAGRRVLCTFSTSQPGLPADGRFHSQCVWCNPDEMQRRLASAQHRKLLAFNLSVLRELDTAVFDRALSDHEMKRLATIGKCLVVDK